MQVLRDKLTEIAAGSLAGLSHHPVDLVRIGPGASWTSDVLPGAVIFYGR